jgi:hypothetical protein
MVPVRKAPDKKGEEIRGSLLQISFYLQRDKLLITMDLF